MVTCKTGLLLLLFIVINYPLFSATLELKILDEKSKAPVPTAVVTVLDPVQHVAYPDTEGKVILNLNPSLPTLQIKIEADCYHSLEKQIRIPLTLEPQTLLLQRYCFDPNKIGILICDFVNSEGITTEATKNWAEKILRRLEEKQKADEKLSKIMEVRRWEPENGAIATPEQAEKLGLKTKASMVVYSPKRWICEVGTIEFCVAAKILKDIPVQAKDTGVHQGIYQGKITSAELPRLIGVDTDTMISFVLGYTYLNDPIHKEYQQAVRYLANASTKAFSNVEDQQTIQFYYAQKP